MGPRSSHLKQKPNVSYCLTADLDFDTGPPVVMTETDILRAKLDIAFTYMERHGYTHPRKTVEKQFSRTRRHHYLRNLHLLPEDR